MKKPTKLSKAHEIFHTYPEHKNYRCVCCNLPCKICFPTKTIEKEKLKLLREVTEGANADQREIMKKAERIKAENNLVSKCCGSITFVAHGCDIEGGRVVECNCPEEGVTCWNICEGCGRATDAITYAQWCVDKEI